MDSPVWPLARLVRYSSFDARAEECPEYVRITHGRSAMPRFSRSPPPAVTPKDDDAGGHAGQRDQQPVARATVGLVHGHHDRHPRRGQGQRPHHQGDDGAVRSRAAEHLPPPRRRPRPGQRHEHEQGGRGDPDEGDGAGGQQGDAGRRDRRGLADRSPVAGHAGRAGRAGSGGDTSRPTRARAPAPRASTVTAPVASAEVTTSLVHVVELPAEPDEVIVDPWLELVIVAVAPPVDQQRPSWCANVTTNSPTAKAGPARARTTAPRAPARPGRNRAWAARTAPRGRRGRVTIERMNSGPHIVP